MFKRLEKRIAYAEAVKVSGETKNKEREVDMETLKQPSTQGNSERIYVQMELVTFIAGVINSTEEVKSKNDKIQLVVKAAVNHLGLVGLTWEEVRETLTKQSSQEASCHDWQLGRSVNNKNALIQKYESNTHDGGRQNKNRIMTTYET